MLLDGLMADAPGLSRNRERIASLLMSWRDVRPGLDVVFHHSPVLHEAKELPQELSEVGLIGLEALSYISAGESPPARWREDKLARLEEAAKPRADVELVVVGPVRELVILAAER
jgi:hypothetical protein